jgi:ADP-ribosylglycohydrolase
MMDGLDAGEGDLPADRAGIVDYEDGGMLRCAKCGCLLESSPDAAENTKCATARATHPHTHTLTLFHTLSLSLARS